jgi:hypothetical protein
MAGQAAAMRDGDVCVRIPYNKTTKGGVYRFDLPRGSGLPVSNIYVKPDAFVNGPPAAVIVTVAIAPDDGYE